MRGLVAFAVSLALVGCGQTRSQPGGGTSIGCGDAGLVPRDHDAAAKDVGVGDAAPVKGDAAPNPATWSCNTDDDCAVFPKYPFCDGHRCAPAEWVETCVVGGVHQPESPEVKHTYIGSNGTFSDSCDHTGSLVDHYCKFETKCGSGPNPTCNNYDTGEVLSRTRDCAGTCLDGRCNGRCPQQGDHITFLDTGSDGSAVIHNDSDGRAYSCTLDSDNPNDSFDCKTVAKGQTGTIVSRSVIDTQCIGADFGGFGVVLHGVPTKNGSDSCSYKCSIDPTPICSP